ncbi:MAG TPA: stilbene synthase, partial [Rubrobacteraceae bacterium]|nr:stilbene synthase [Rubrobacteraceae bacterium]
MSEPGPRILSVATSLPPYRVGQGEAKRFARGMFAEAHRDFERLIPIFDNVHVENRNFCVPVEWF